ncbi:MAG: bifunctional [glutamate--ammonia ligase]-adenylyl-L-tyrosine phosphorylase/[glutamate--ammonia-ligase] adenylyltransferase [Deltaproteobacteria bacterium]|nr:bifunctional [glutamate--ammonia ligase]-adenylyl-L-tyrosine phosphorylase/[glutamate--ammonia-ligase] adenylyltransferase [Deltaproteobacteria bacterium]
MSQAEIEGHDRGEIILSLFSPAERATITRDEATAKALWSLAAYSPALTQALAVRPELVRWLFLDRSFQYQAAPQTLIKELAAQAADVSDLKTLQIHLRRFRLKELARLAIRDFTNQADLTEVMETLTALAETCLDLALRFAMRSAAVRWDLSQDDLGVVPIILGMGKLGAAELNYSSDIDLICLYQPVRSSDKTPDPGVVAEFIFTTVTKAMSEVTEDGLVFRVDQDLRPGGKDGAQAQSVEAASRHYLALGQPWERMALLKARPVAGDLTAGQEFLDSLIPFIFRRYLDYTALEELKALKARFTEEKRIKTRRLNSHRSFRTALDIKLSAGGIREIEFFVQALILTFGGRLPHLRRAGTLDALSALADEGIISREDEDELSEAYVFLRRIEHRLQLRELTQTQTLPRSETALDNLARSMCYTGAARDDFLADLKEHMNRVSSRFRLLLADPEEAKVDTKAPHQEGVEEKVHLLLKNLDDETLSLNLLTRLGFKRSEAALAACRTIQEERYLPDSLARYREQLERLMPALIAQASAAPDPDQALAHLERFLTRIGPMGGFLLLLEENPKLIQLLTTLFGTSEYLSGILINHPGILDSLIDRRSARLVKNRAALAADLSTALLGEEDPEARLSLIRRFKNDEVLRLGLYDLLGELSLDQVQDQLTSLAEVIMDFTMALAAELVPNGIGLPLAVMGLGKLGGRELNYRSDLDLIFALGGRVSGGKTNANIEVAVRVVQRFISFLSLPLAEGPGYEIDSRLRPSGTYGPLVVTPVSLDRYHQTSQLWERQALLKMRRILGPKNLGSRIKGLANRAVFGGPLPSDAAERIHHLRLRMAAERGKLRPGMINFKFSPGGLVDIEFITQYLQMIYGRKYKGDVRSASTKKALLALSRKGLGPDGLKEVAEAYELMSHMVNRLGLIHVRGGDEAAYTEQEIAALGLPDIPGDPLSELYKAMDLVKSVYAQVFGQDIDHAG